MPQQVLLRQLTRKLRPGTLAGFWQGRYTLQPWNQVANSAYSQPPAPQGQTWDTGADFGFAAHSHITNPSTGLDSIYQKHVWSRLVAAEPPESADGDHRAQARALAAAAAFATLQPAAAAAAMQAEDEDRGGRAGYPNLPVPLKPAALPAAVLPSIAETPSAIQAATDTINSTADRTNDLSSIAEEPEEPEQALLAAYSAAPAAAAHPAAAEPSGGLGCQDLAAADTGFDRAEAGSEATDTRASIPQAAYLPVSVAAVVGHQPGTAVSPTLTCEPAATSTLSTAKEIALHGSAAEPSATHSLRASAQHAERGAAKQLLPLPALTAPDTPRLSKEALHAILSGGMHAVHAEPLLQDMCTQRMPGNDHADKRSVPTPDSKGMDKKTNPDTADESQGRIRTIAPLYSSSRTTAMRSPLEQISRPAPAVSCQVSIPPVMSHARPGALAREVLVSRPSTTAAALCSSEHDVQAQPAAAGGRSVAQTAGPSQAPERRHRVATAAAFRAMHSAANALQPVLAALGCLLDADSMKVSGYLPGLVIAHGNICGRPVHACHLDTDSIAPSSQLAACRALCSMMDAAILAGSPVVTIHGARNQGTATKLSSASAVTAAELAGWTPAVQRHMDASGVVPQLAVSLGQLSTVSSLLASICDYSFSRTGSCSDRRASENHEQDSSSSSSSCSLRCRQGMSQQESCSNASSSMEESLHRARRLLVMLPSSNSAPPPKVPCHDPPWRACSGLQHIQSPLDLCTRLADAGLIAGSWAAAGTAHCFGRLDCSTVGFIAMPCSAVLPGLYSRCSLAQVIKAVRFCSAFNLPIISVLMLPQREALTQDTTSISDLANLIFAYNEATVPKLAVVCGLEAAAAEKCLRSDMTLVWTSNTLKRPREQQKFSRLTAAQAASGSAERCIGIRPEDTRAALCNALRPLLANRLVAAPRRKHALLPRVC